MAFKEIFLSQTDNTYFTLFHQVREGETSLQSLILWVLQFIDFLSKFEKVLFLIVISANAEKDKEKWTPYSTQERDKFSCFPKGSLNYFEKIK